MLRVRNEIKENTQSLKLKQKDWMKPYIDFNTKKQKK